MINNILKIAFRSLLRRKGYTFLNIVGLALGISVCLLILLYVQSELSFDNFHTNGNNIYRVVLDRKYPGRSTSYAVIPLSIGKAIQNENPEVLQSTRLFNLTHNEPFYVKMGDKAFEEKNVISADSNFFRVFTAVMIEGDTSTALRKPNTAVITETTAKKFFGSVENAIGKSFESDNEKHFIISGVCKDWPHNSHFDFDILISSSSFISSDEINYTVFSCNTYLLLNPQSSISNLEGKFPHIIEKYVSGEIERSFGLSFQEFQKAGNGYHYYLQPLRKIHLISDMAEGELKPNGSSKAVYVFSLIAVFILLIACINFINLSTARSMERAKEVGIRKTFGSEKSALIWQFLFEAVLITFMSLILAIIILISLLPLFNKLSGLELKFLSQLTPLHCFLLFLFSMVIGLVAGLYPAFVLSSFKPIMVLKGKFKSNKYGMALRNGLVVFQFTISVILIICTVMVNHQMQFMLGEKIGFKKDHVIEIEHTDLVRKQTKAFKTELAKIPGVETVCTASSFPGQERFWGAVFQEFGSNISVSGKAVIVGNEYDSLLGIELKAGRFFSKEFSTDSLSIVLNEKAAEELGLKNPIGSRLTSVEEYLNGPHGEKYVYTVIGVIKDFHFQSLHQKISPLLLLNAGRFGDEMGITGIRIKSNNFNAVIESMERIWKDFVKERPLHYDFLDRSVADLYHGERTTRRIFTFFAVFAIFIACIGLFGLVAYATQLRRHEIGIRKVLGASVSNIFVILSTEFLKLIIISALIAFPIAWWFMHEWLQNFAYRAEIAWWIFLFAGLISAIIALFTISFHTFKAAAMNPVKSLRSE